MKPLQHLLPYLPAYKIVGDLDPARAVTLLTNDSRHVREGALFIAYEGRSNDLHRFVPDAARQGALAAIVERPLEVELPQIVVPDAREAWGWLAAAWEDHPSRRLRVIGVTGTDGKTTTTHLIGSVLDALGFSYGMINTIGAQIGARQVETGEHVTTPDAPVVQRFLREMADEGMQVALLETTSHALAQHRVTGVAYDVAVVTNITHEHLDEHGTIEAYRAAKRSLFERLCDSYRKPDTPKVAVLNADDSSYATLAAIGADSHLAYGIDNPVATVRARDIRFERDGTRFVAETPIGSFPVASPLLGRFNVYNILAALSVGIVFGGANIAALQAGIAGLAVVKGRMEPIDEGQDFLAIVDFAHTPVSLENALATAREMTDGRVIALFGSAGLRDRAKRGMMGEIGGRLADLTIITAEDPRTERVEDICEEIAEGAERAGARRDDTYKIIYDRAEAIAYAVEQAQPGDLVIACGKGHEPSMCYGTTETPWSEHEAMRDALRRVVGTP